MLETRTATPPPPPPAVLCPAPMILLAELCWDSPCCGEAKLDGTEGLPFDGVAVAAVATPVLLILDTPCSNPSPAVPLALLERRLDGSPGPGPPAPAWGSGRRRGCGLGLLSASARPRRSCCCLTPIATLPSLAPVPAPLAIRRSGEGEALALLVVSPS
ncbi:hypothetical protein Vretifemale_3401, partial [Volvox reticuliferus]